MGQFFIKDIKNLTTKLQPLGKMIWCDFMKVFFCPIVIIVSTELATALKVAFSQKRLMRLSFLLADNPNYFPELEFWISFHSKWLKSCQIRTWICSNAVFEHSEQLHVLIWHDLSHLEWRKNLNSSSQRNDKPISPF